MAAGRSESAEPGNAAWFRALGCLEREDNQAQDRGDDYDYDCDQEWVDAVGKAESVGARTPRPPNRRGKNTLDNPCRAARLPLPMIESKGLSVALVSVVLALSVFSAGMSLIYVLNLRTLSRLQSRVSVVNNDKSLLNSLLADCLEYSKKNPALEPLLHSVGLKTRSAPAQPTPRPSTR